MFPHGDFDSFIGNVERLSGTCALRHEVHELRMRLLRVRCGLQGAMLILVAARAPAVPACAAAL